MTNTRFSLKTGDLIRLQVKRTTVDGGKGDPSRWKNVDNVKIVHANGTSSLDLATHVYGVVKKIGDDTAVVEHQRGVYKQNHLPGDSIEVVTREPIGSRVCKATTENSGNLDGIYVSGANPGATLNVQIVKVRCGTAFTVPEKIIDEGIGAGQQVSVNVEQGSPKATHLNSEFDIQLSEPAAGSGITEIEVTDSSSSPIQGLIRSYPVDLPEAGDRIATKVSTGNRTTVFKRGTWTFEAELDHEPLIDGTANVRITDRDGASYFAELIDYERPKIASGMSLPAEVSKWTNEASTTVDGVPIKIKITNRISKSGQATVRITDLSDQIYGRVTSSIESVEKDSTVDVTNLSKL